MTVSNFDSQNSMIEQVLSLVHEHVAPEHQDTVAQFVSNYYSSISSSELRAETARDLYSAALSHWKIAVHRQPGMAKVRVYTPMIERHGWNRVHTIVDVVCDDMPFVVDSLRIALQVMGHNVHTIIHPSMRVERTIDGKAQAIDAAQSSDSNSRAELFLHFEIDAAEEKPTHSRIKARIQTVIDCVHAAVEDWDAMRARLQLAAADLQTARNESNKRQLDEAIAMLTWLDEGNFTLLGYQHYSLNHQAETAAANSALGLFRDSGGNELHSGVDGPLAVEGTTDVVLVTKADTRSVVHRPGYYDYIALRQFDGDGKCVGEHVFIGHFTSTAYTSSIREIPWIRAKASSILTEAPYSPDSHSGHALLNALETLPRDEVFRLDEATLHSMATEVARAEQRQKVSVFLHREQFGRFFSCLILLPRDRFNTKVRDAIQRILTTTLEAADSEFEVQLNSSRLARASFVLRVDPAKPTDAFNLSKVEAQITAATRTWADDLETAIYQSFGDKDSPRLAKRYADAFKADYQEHHTCEHATCDIEEIESLGESGIAINLRKDREAGKAAVTLRLFHARSPVSLSTALDMLENMGLTVSEARPYRIDPRSSAPIWIHDFSMHHDENEDFDVDASAERFIEAYLQVWNGQVENDEFNRLVISTGLQWREVVALRTYSRYLKQIGTTFSESYIQKTLCANPTITRGLVELFHARLDPAHANDADANAIQKRIEAALDKVESLDEDRILRRFLAVISATLRSNFYQTDESGSLKSYVSIKLDPREVPGLPNPKPRFEVFVYSPRVEGVHLRGGPIARGGLRWSDRPEDFRTEVLGLMKAQTIKNSVIVPHGAKGGFVPKLLDQCADRAEEGKACYRLFIRGLLDITDNLNGKEVVPPADVIRHDGDDPYLVVAADKGTATYSDIANALAAEYGFWLGDAFASGGSVGYDHKAMGITARGAWESVKRHFRELGLDTQSTTFTVAGIGDMAGDVFGNGLLRTPYAKLIAAFNHAHIFLDPDPDPEKSFAERSRLFALPRSSWTDYDTGIISAGGGVFPRSAKSITLTPEVRKALDIDSMSLTPTELISAILRAPVDLLWNGGIGTYVKSRSEQHAAAGDRNNDAVRINGDELRCKVVGEGGNLGLTQPGRIEFAANGGHIYTDSIDNSAGVDCSDHEVNIKILLNQVVADGALSLDARNALLAEMTDEVASLVLKTNYIQTQTLSLAAEQAASMLDVHARLITRLENANRFDRHVENLPDDETLAERRKEHRGLTRPELAVLIGHVKLALSDDVLNTDLPDSPFLVRELHSYFPKTLREQFADRISEHPLGREIISTVVANEIVNNAGITFVFRLQEETGATTADIARAYFVSRDVFDQTTMRQEVNALDNQVSAQAQTQVLLEGRKLAERASRWLLRNLNPHVDVLAAIDLYREGVKTVSESLATVADPASGARIEKNLERFSALGIPPALAQRAAGYEELLAALDIQNVARATNAPVAYTAAVYFALGAALSLHWIRDQISDLPRSNRWQTLARTALREDLNLQERQLVTAVMHFGDDDMAAEARVAQWLASHSAASQRCLSFMQALMEEASTDTSMLSAVLREIRGLTLVTAPHNRDSYSTIALDSTDMAV